MTPADIQRVARRWLRDERSAALRYLPEEARGTAHGDTIAHRRDRRGRAAGAARRHRRSSSPRPRPSASRRRRRGRRSCPPVPAPVIQRLANGLTLITVPSRACRWSRDSLVARGGAADDPAGRAGTAALTAR